MALPKVYVKSVLFTLLVPMTVAVAVPQLLATWRPHPKLPISVKTGRVFGTLSLLVGIGVYVHTTVRFGSEGGGTPSPRDEPETLVTGGLYSYSRNPMYIGVLLVLLGQALRQRSVSILWWGVGMWIGFHNRVIGFEEPHLAEKHGKSYEQYRRRVPRWLW